MIPVLSFPEDNSHFAIVLAHASDLFDRLEKIG